MIMINKKNVLLFLTIVLMGSGCFQAPLAEVTKTRAEAIPAEAVKMSQATDNHPPILHSSEFVAPVPVEGLVNTAGAEDSAFVLPNGETLYFFFTPDVTVPVERQVIDGVTGIYISHLVEGAWGEPERVMLKNAGEDSLDGCEFVQGDTMWFCAARTGYTGVNLFTAEYNGEHWTNIKIVPEILQEYLVGEMHLSSDGDELYFHSDRAGGNGGFDLWLTRLVDGTWSEPENVSILNSQETDGWPALNADETELWFTRTYLGTPAIYRSKKSDGAWQYPELILSQFAGEPTIDAAGNVYFTHHYYQYGEMIEADIYVARKK